jgi:flagellar biosynthesis/type III secretory pathway M-ring protein FliF/YscJ
MKRGVVFGFLILVFVSSFCIAGTKSVAEMEFNVYDSSAVADEPLTYEKSSYIEDSRIWLVPLFVVLIIFLLAFLYARRKRRNASRAVKKKTVKKAKKKRK